MSKEEKRLRLHNDELNIALDASFATVLELRSALRDLVDALPRCDECLAPATHHDCSNAELYCDDHIPAGRHDHAQPYAAPLRNALALLAETKGQS
jgi:hypothetical protein